MESRVLPQADVAAALQKFVRVKINVRAPGAAQRILDKIGPNTLPIYAFLTPDGRLVSHTSGFRDVEVFKADLAAVMKHELLAVPAAADQKLAKMAGQAEDDLKAGRIAGALKTARAAAGVRGFSTAKDRIEAVQRQAVEAGRRKLSEAADLCGQSKFEDALKAAQELAKDFKGTDLERAATAAKKAVDRFKAASKEEDPTGKAARRHYELVVKECQDAAPFVALARSKLP